MTLHPFRRLARSLFAPRRTPVRRLRFDRLEDRVVPTADPVQLNTLEFRILSDAGDWSKPLPYIYQTTQSVAIGYKVDGATSWTPILSIDDGVSINTLTNKFTIDVGAENKNDNFLLYYPGGSGKQAAPLFHFIASYEFTESDVVSPTNDGLGDANGVTVPSGKITPLAPADQLPVAGELGRLAPERLLVTHGKDSNSTPEVQLAGSLGIRAAGAVLADLLKGLNLNITGGTTYVVAADATGAVNLVSQSGNGVKVSIAPGTTFQLSGVDVTVKDAHFAYLTDKTNGSRVVLGGDFLAALKDDTGPTGTKVLVSIGDSEETGLVLVSPAGQSGLHVKEFQFGLAAADQGPGLTVAGMHVGVQGLYFQYKVTTDGQGTRDTFGLAGEVDLTWTDAGGKDPGQKVTLTTGDALNQKAGVLIEDGRLTHFDGEVTGDFNLKGLKLGALSEDVRIVYDAADTTTGTPSAVAVSGQLTAYVKGVAIGVAVDPARPVLYSAGKWVVGSIQLSVDGTFTGPAELKIAAKSLKIGYAETKGPDGKTHDTFTLSGGVELPEIWHATLTFNDGTQPGLVIQDGEWELNGLQYSIDDISFGGAVGLKGVKVDFERTADGTGYDLKLAGKIVLPPGVEVDGSIEVRSGAPVSLGVEYKATGDDPGLPLGDTGLFVTDLGLQLTDFVSADVVVEAEIGVGFGEQVTFLGRQVRLFSAAGHVKIDRHEFDLDASFQAMDGLLGSGTAAVTLDWSKHDYRATFDVALYDQTIDIRGLFHLNEFNQIAVNVDASLRVPHGIPFIGGTTLAGVDGLFYWDPVLKPNSLVAGWADLDLLVTHLRGGLEYVFYPAGNGKHLKFIHGGAVSRLETFVRNAGAPTQVTFADAAVTDPAANQSLFHLTYAAPNKVGAVSLSVPGLATPVLMDFNLDPASKIYRFTLNGQKFNVIRVDHKLAALGVTADPAAGPAAQMVSWLIAADAKNPYAVLPTGAYPVTVTLAEPPPADFQARLDHTEATTPPTVTVSPAAGFRDAPSNLVTLTANYQASAPAQTTIEFLYTTDPAGSSGVRIGNVVQLTAADPQQGTRSITWDLSGLAVGQKFYVFARIADPTNPAVLSAVSDRGVTPYPTLTAQVNVSPVVPVDQSPAVLANWPVTWQQLVNGQPSGAPYFNATDGFGRAGIAAAPGTVWQVAIAPPSYLGFDPLPAAGQTASPSGRITQTVTAGSVAAPAAFAAAYQDKVSVRGRVGLDLSDHRYTPGGAGVSGRVVYDDLNNNSQLDDGEARTTTDAAGNYDLRFPVGTAAVTHTVRLAADAARGGAYVRTNPDSAADLSFAAGAAYTVTVNPLDPTQRLTFLTRDFLAEATYIVSGVAYQSGPTGAAYGPRAMPVGGQAVTIRSADGTFTQTATTAADGSYLFRVPGPGSYTVATASQNPAAVNLPARHAFGYGPTAQPTVTITNTAGQPVTMYGIDTYFAGNVAGHLFPLAASGDFYGDGRWSTAVVSTPDKYVRGDQQSDVYLTVYRGAAPGGAVTAEAALIGQRLDPVADKDRVPSAFRGAGSGHDVVILASPAYGTYWYDPAARQSRAFDRPAVPFESARLLAVDASATDNVFLYTSPAGNDWSLVAYTGTGGPGRVLASFALTGGPGVGTSNGLRPVPQTNDLTLDFTSGSVEDLATSRWGLLTHGDFDGDGADDYAFSALDAGGRQVIGYVLSRENFASVRAIPLGSWVPGEDPAAVFWTVGVSAVALDGPGGPASLAVHRTRIAAGAPTTTDVLVFHARPADPARVAAGDPAAAFAFASVYPVGVQVSTDRVADVTGDGRPDLVLFGTAADVVTVLANLGGGRFAAPADVSVGANSFSRGLVSDGSAARPGVGAVPAFLSAPYFNFPLATQDPLNAPFLTANATAFSNSYVAVVNSPGSFGGYDFGFVSGGTPAAGVSGTAFVDANGNGRQDPGEANRPGLTLRVTRPGQDSVTVTTDAAGRYSLTAAAGAAVSLVGAFPANVAPAPAAGSTLVKTLDSADPTASYGKRQTYTVQADAVQPAGLVRFVTGDRTGGAWANDLFVQFGPDDDGAYFGIGVGNASTFAQAVWDTPDGNPAVGAVKLPTGTKVGERHNYAVTFDRAANTLTFYVDAKPRKTLNLTTYASGRFAAYSNAAVAVTADGSQPVSNFRVGAPYVGYDLAGTPAGTGYDFGVSNPAAALGAIQGAVYLAGGAAWAPTDQPYAGLTVFLDDDADGTRDPGEPFTTTAADGTYRFTGLAPGTYLVATELPAGVARRYVIQPAAGVDVEAGQTTYGITFGVTKTAQFHDFNRDGTADYVRLVPGVGTAVEVRFDLMTGAGLGRTVAVGSFDARQWRPVGAADLDGDGAEDVLFQSQTDNALVYWSVRDGAKTGEGTLARPAGEWRAVAAIDLGAGVSVVMHNVRTGAVEAWAVAAGQVVRQVPLGVVGPTEQVAGAVDLTGDSRADLLIRDEATGRLTVWALDASGRTAVGDAGTAPPGSRLAGAEPWKVAGAAGADLLWQDEATGGVTRRGYAYAAGATGDAVPISPAGLAGELLTSHPAAARLLAPIADANGSAGRPLAVAPQLTPTAAGRSLRFAFAGAAPAGAVIDPVTGVITWTPGAGDRNRRVAVTVLVEDPALPAVRDIRTFTVAVDDAVPPVPPIPPVPPVPPVPPAPPVVRLRAVGTGVGDGPLVRVFNPDGSERFRFFAFDPAFRGGVSVATGDVTGDGVDDVVAAAGPGGGPHVRVFDGATGNEVASFFAYDPAFRGGVSVAVGDLDGDGRADIVTGAGAGGGPHVRVFSGDGSERFGFFAYAPDFRGGVSVVVGDVDGDGRADVVTGAGAGGGPHVRVFDGATGRELASFFAYAADFRGGVSVAVGDLDGDGRADIVTGAGAGGGPHVRVFDGESGQPVGGFMAGDPAGRTGVRVAVVGLPAGGPAAVVTRTDAGAAVRTYYRDGRPVPSDLLPDESILAGVFVS